MACRRGPGHRRAAGFLAGAITLFIGCMLPPDQDVRPSITHSLAPIDRAAVQNVVRQFFADDPSGPYRNRRAVLVSVRDKLLVEDYHQSSATTPINIQSMGTSIISSLVGIALNEGRLTSVDQTVGELLPSSTAAMSSKTKAITLRQLLTMSAGLPPDGVFISEVLEQPDWVQHILATGPTAPPGEKFEYSSAGSHLLSAILCQATGKPTLQYARERLFHPLGIRTTPETGFDWPVDPQGVHIGGGGQKLTARDMLRLGRLWLHGGRWMGRQVIPGGWMREATRAHVKPGVDVAPGYGYQFWTVQAQGHPAFAAFGYGGQLVEVVPDLSLVVVVLSTSPSDPRTAAEPGTAQPENYVTMVDQVIIPALERRS